MADPAAAVKAGEIWGLRVYDDAMTVVMRIEQVDERSVRATTEDGNRCVVDSKRLEREGWRIEDYQWPFEARRGA